MPICCLYGNVDKLKAQGNFLFKGTFGSEEFLEDEQWTVCWNQKFVLNGKLPHIDA